METAVVSGRVPLATKERAGVYIKQAGLSVGDVIQNVWDHIARTGEVPMPAPKEKSKQELWNEFMAFRSELSRTPSKLGNLSDEQIKDLIAERYV